jgi:hypothetical protein
MRTRAKNAATTPIPVQLAATDFHKFIFPYLSMPKRGPTCKLGYHCLFVNVHVATRRAVRCVRKCTLRHLP